MENSGMKEEKKRLFKCCLQLAQNNRRHVRTLWPVMEHAHVRRILFLFNVTINRMCAFVSKSLNAHAKSIFNDR